MTIAPQTRIPTSTFSRWIHRTQLTLPVPMTTTYAATQPIDPDDLVELTTDRIAGSASAAALEGLPVQVERVLAETEDLLRNPSSVAFALRTDKGTTTTVCGLVRGRQGLLFIDGPQDVVLRPVEARAIADAVVRALPAVRPASLPPVAVPTALLSGLAGGAGATAAGRDRLADLAGVDRDVVAELSAIERTVTSGGFVGVVPGAGLSTAMLGAEWRESQRGAVLRTSLDADRVLFEPATPARLTRFLVDGLAAV